MSKKNKKFDCVDSKNKTQAKIYKDTKGMSHEDQILYFKKNAESGSLGQWFKNLKLSSVKKRQIANHHKNSTTL